MSVHIFLKTKKSSFVRLSKVRAGLFWPLHLKASITLFKNQSALPLSNIFKRIVLADSHIYELFDPQNPKILLCARVCCPLCLKNWFILRYSWFRSIIVSENVRPFCFGLLQFSNEIIYLSNLVLWFTGLGFWGGASGRVASPCSNDMGSILVCAGLLFFSSYLPSIVFLCMRCISTNFLKKQ